MTVSCWLSEIPLKGGAADTKSSHVTVAKEFTFDTRKLENIIIDHLIYGQKKTENRLFSITVMTLYLMKPFSVK